tara:strand:- start:32498 stop:32800 length:303 start_codon:yes stop_codon:yes gene_type:complete
MKTPSKFTKGKWQYDVHGLNEHKKVCVYIPNGGFEITNTPNAEANACLIASAPSLYKSLERQRVGLINLIELDIIVNSHHESVRHEISLIDNELAKARGE